MSLISTMFANELNEKEMRDAYLSAQTRTHLSYQIRTIRSQRGWSQEEFAERLDTSQSAVSRMEDREYGKQNLQTLIDVANEFDCGLLVQFVPYEEFIRKTDDLSREALEVPEFDSAALLPLSENLPAVEVKGLIGLTGAYLTEPAYLAAPNNALTYSAFWSQLASLPAAASPRGIQFTGDVFRYIQQATPPVDLKTRIAELEAEVARLETEEKSNQSKMAFIIVNQQSSHHQSF